MRREPNQACREVGGGRGGRIWAGELKPYSQGGFGGGFRQDGDGGVGQPQRWGLPEEGKGGQGSLPWDG